MIKGLYQTAGSMVSRQKNMDIIANNLAHINSTAFKRQLPFAEVLARKTNEQNTQLTDFSQGGLTKTDNMLDLAISENAFFMVETDKGTELTSNGKFKISKDGYLVNDNGNRVMGKSGSISLFDTILEQKENVEIRKNGEILIAGEIIDQLAIAKIESQKNMVRTGGSSFQVSEENYSYADDESYEIVQGYIEESNVNPVMEMQAMIAINKDYEVANKVVQSMDQILGYNREIGRV